MVLMGIGARKEDRSRGGGEGVWMGCLARDGSGGGLMGGGEVGISVGRGGRWC